MKALRGMTILLILCAALALPTRALAQPPTSPLFDEIVIGSVYTLPSGSVLNGNLLAFGGVVTIEEGALVTGDVIGFGTDMNIDGEINGSLIAIGSSLSLEEHAVVQGDLIVPQTALYRSSGAVINGQVLTESGPVKITVPSVPEITPPRVPVAVVDTNPVGEAFKFIIQAFAFSALAVVAIIFLPKRVEVTSKAIVSHTVTTGGLGLLTLVAFPLLMGLMALLSLLLLSPVSILGMVVYGASIAFGWIAVGFELGKKVEEAFKQDWTPALQTGVGTFVLTLVAGLIGLIPCIGFLGWLLVAAMGLGAVLLTRFGGQEYLGPVVAPVAQTIEGEILPLDEK